MVGAVPSFFFWLEYSIGFDGVQWQHDNFHKVLCLLLGAVVSINFTARS